MGNPRQVRIRHQLRRGRELARQQASVEGGHLGLFLDHVGQGPGGLQRHLRDSGKATGLGFLVRVGGQSIADTAADLLCLRLLQGLRGRDGPLIDVALVWHWVTSRCEDGGTN